MSLSASIVASSQVPNDSGNNIPYRVPYLAYIRLNPKLWLKDVATTYCNSKIQDMMTWRIPIKAR